MLSLFSLLSLWKCNIKGRRGGGGGGVTEGAGFASLGEQAFIRYTWCMELASCWWGQFKPVFLQIDLIHDDNVMTFR